MDKTQTSLSELVESTSRQFEKEFLEEMKRFSSLPTIEVAIWNQETWNHKPIPTQIAYEQLEEFRRDHLRLINGFLIEKANSENNFTYVILTTEGLFQCGTVVTKDACFYIKSNWPVWSERTIAPNKLWVDHANQVVECFTEWKKKVAKT